MYQNSRYFLLCFFLSLEITSSTTGAVSTSTSPVTSTESAVTSVQSTNTTSFSSSPLSVTPTLLTSTATIVTPSTSQSIKPSIFPTPPVGNVSLTSTVQATASVGAQPTKPSTGTSATGTKDTKNEELKIVGYVIFPIVGVLVIVFVVYYCVVRKRARNWAIGNDTTMEALAPSGKATASQKTVPEAGTTHQAFVGDSDGPNKGTVSAAPGVKVA